MRAVGDRLLRLAGAHDVRSLRVGCRVPFEHVDEGGRRSGGGLRGRHRRPRLRGCFWEDGLGRADGGDEVARARGLVRIGERDDIAAYFTAQPRPDYPASFETGPGAISPRMLVLIRWQRLTSRASTLAPGDQGWRPQLPRPLERAGLALDLDTTDERDRHARRVRPPSRSGRSGSIPTTRS